MAQITLDIPNDKIAQVVEALCNGVSPTNAKAKIELIRMVKDRVATYYAEKAEASNRTAINTAVTAKDTAVAAAKTDAEAISIT